MKITLINKNSGTYEQNLSKTASKLGIDFEVRDIKPGTISKDFGDIVLWRSSSLGASEKRQVVMARIMESSILINRCLAKFPHGAQKFFQQDYVKKNLPFINTIETFRFNSIVDLLNAVKKGVLRYPFIEKPNLGARGNGVRLIQNETSLSDTLNIEKFVYQNFIRNSGDYRVLMLGGKPLGVIKRIAKEDGFLNNISQGGSALHITDVNIVKPLQHIGAAIASLFDLTFCGVDVIYDEAKKQYVFLEVNTVPQWHGFKKATGIDVDQELLLHCKRIAKRLTQKTFDLVKTEYTEQSRFLSDKSFHFFSRMYLWTREASCKKQLAILQKTYIGITNTEHRNTIQKFFNKQSLNKASTEPLKRLREEYFKKYLNLQKFLNILFKHLFAETIYNVDMHPYIQECVSEEDFLELKEALENDPQALRILSTHAINYLYLVENYLGKEKCPLQVEKYLTVGLSYEKPDAYSFQLQLYFFTHCIIGASRFYNEKIQGKHLSVYRQMIETMDTIITDNFEKISLDNKFEFLVCAKICEFQSKSEKSILKEASQSLSPNGNFLIDILNKNASIHSQNDFIKAEHRNVLFIMANMPFQTEDSIKTGQSDRDRLC
jgi:glutathione synthase/RimK-type ligase-like ATP-grasp enzyme